MTIAHFYVCVIGFLCGVFLATVFSISLATITWLFFMALVSLVIWKRSRLLQENVTFLFVALAVFSLALGTLRFDIADSRFGHSELAKLVGTDVVFKGVVSAEPDMRESNQYLYIKNDEDLVLVSTERYQDIRYGDLVEVRGELEIPESFTTDFGRVFDYAGYLKARGVEYRISFAKVTILEKGHGNLVISRLLEVKQQFVQRFESLVPEPAAGLGEGLLLGVKQAIGTELETAFRQTGIIHIVVLSGYNVMLVVIFIMYVLGQFLAPRPQLVVGILAIAAFALMVGLTATVVRASLMVSLLLIMQATGRSYLILRGLLLAGSLMIIHNPHLLVYDIGFQLSFLATLGLVLIAPYLERFVTRVPDIAGMRNFLIATIATQLAVLPLLLYQIGEFSVVAVLVNVLVLPMVPVAMMFTFATGVAGFIFPVLATFLVYPTVFSLQYIIEVARFFSQFSFSSFAVPVFSVWLVPLAYTCMGLFLVYVYRNGSMSGQSMQSEHLFLKQQPFLSDWTIVEESELDIKPEAKTKVAEPKEGSATNVPIFFR